MAKTRAKGIQLKARLATVVKVQELENRVADLEKQVDQLTTMFKNHVHLFLREKPSAQH